MTKNDLKLIQFFIDKNNPKVELNYAYLAHDCIYATDTRKLIKYHANMLGLNLRLHKKLLGGFISLMCKDSNANIDGFGNILCDGVKMSCDTFNENISDSYKFVDFDRILDTQFEYKISLASIEDIQFELSQRECFIDDIHLFGAIAYSECVSYDVLFNKQKIEDNLTNTGVCKIIGYYNPDDETTDIRFEAVIMGREFKTQAQEQLLLDL